MPALNKVREQARNTICSANLKQIGYYIPLYQADNDGYVPVLRHKYGIPAFAKYNYLSAALWNYHSDKKLPSNLDLEGEWPLGRSLYHEYVADYLPKYFVCPTVRGKKGDYKRLNRGFVSLGGVPILNQVVVGIDDSYVPWQHPWKRGHVGYANHPLGGKNGTLEYGALTWYHPADHDKVRNNNSLATLKSVRPIAWTRRFAQDQGGSSLGDVTVLHCDRGQHMVGVMNTSWYINYGSHKKRGSGGTNVLFADFHVGWVNGSRLAW
jgi:prepilin-type processing-associated H-X9-DG protein